MRFKSLSHLPRWFIPCLLVFWALQFVFRPDLLPKIGSSQPPIERPVTNPYPPYAVLSKVTGDFAAALQSALGGPNDQNVVFSPFSVHCALAMTLAGAGGETAAEMMRALAIGDTARYEALQLDYSTFLFAVHSLQFDSDGKPRTSPRAEIGIANRIYAQNGAGLADKFLEITTDVFRSPVEEADFSGHSERERVKINGFVADATRGLITDLIQEGLLTSDTRMVLVNAIYFKGKWKTQFDKAHTHDALFHLTDGKETATYKAMTLSNEKFSGNTNCRIGGTHFESLSMPYQGEFSMIFLLPPNSAVAMKAVEDKLKELGAEALLEQVLATHSEKTYDTVVIPRCKIEYSAELTPALQSLGMTLAFINGKADFSGMQKPPQEPLSISAVIHKAHMKIDEEGTVAAAATVAALTTSSFVIKDKTEFIVNRPFLAFLVHDPSQVVLFSAKINRPIEG